MNVLGYIAFSALIIMVWQLAFSIRPVTYGLLQMIMMFVIGGIVGYYMDSTITAIVMSIALSLIFI